MGDKVSPPGRAGEIDRVKRRFVAGAVASLVIAPASGVLAAAAGPAERSLWLRHGVTGETVDEVYWVEGQFVPAGVSEINRLLRDTRTGEVLPIDVRLMDLLNAIHRKTESAHPIEIVSGYRSPRTNKMLRRRSGNVARNSLHMEGMAADIRIADRDMHKVRRLAMSLKAGGVAYYRRTGHLHVDVGPVRYW